MWQRIQSVFLGAVAICMAVCIFLPIGVFNDPATGSMHQLYPLHYTVVDGLKRTTLYFPYALSAMLMTMSATLAVISILNFRNRIAQIKIGTLNSLVLALVMVAMVFFFNPLAKQYPGKLGLNLWVTFAAVSFNWLALRFIRKDEKMVRDADRLR